MSSGAVELGAFLDARHQYFPSMARLGRRVEFGAARVHYESRDSWSATVKSCLDWRAEIRLSPLDAHGHAPDVIVGWVDFLVLQLGREPVGEVLGLYGEQAARFEELFDGPWLEPELDESDGFTAGMPIGAVLVVLEARVDERLPPGCGLRPWAVAEVIDRMLPTTAGLAVMSAFDGAPRPVRRSLIAADRIDQDWPLVGCTAVPGHPGFFGQATAYTYLEEARARLSAVGERSVDVELR